jgi:hypothetical protein
MLIITTIKAMIKKKITKMNIKALLPRTVLEKIVKSLLIV